jgi:hypothetical protein
MDSFEKNNELIWSEMIGNLSICLWKSPFASFWPCSLPSEGFPESQGFNPGPGFRDWQSLRDYPSTQPYILVTKSWSRATFLTIHFLRRRVPLFEYSHFYKKCAPALRRVPFSINCPP